MSICASASGSVTTQPYTTQEARSVRYTVGEPVGLESGSLPMNVRRTVGSLS
jgi:hypothetical protein